MPLAGLIAAVLVGPVEAPGAGQNASPDALRSDYTALVGQFARRNRPDPAAVVPPLCDLYERLRDAQGVSHADRRRMLRGVENRLGELHGRLMRDRNAGGASAARADELIRLIQATIAPDTWDVNGGRGTIRFWSPNPALVIRQTGEVHHQIGGTLGALRE